MAKYKQVEVDKHLLRLMPFMSAAEQYREELTGLGNQWDLLTILGKMSGTGTDMSQTRQGFQLLTDDLINQIGAASLKKSVQQMTLRAQVTVDILIRNLFERTADIGFLATDDDIRAFINDPKDPIVIKNRFKEYVAKYSVYSNILLLDPSGKVLVQLDESNSELTCSDDPLIQKAIQTTEDYVEVFRYSDLCPQEQKSLIYAFRVTATNAPGSATLGVLALCFRFEDELEGIFRKLSNEADWSVMLLLDSTGEVIASSDVYQIPKGIQLSRNTDTDYEIIKFSGRQYLAKVCATNGYQGFLGLGWYGMVVIPLDYAFIQENSGGHGITDLVMASVKKHEDLFSSEIRAIPERAEMIQLELERALWNGNIMEDSREQNAQINQSFSKVLLGEIGKTGMQTKSVFERSIANLNQTVVTSVLDDVLFYASLAIDIMDRNLYERANDVRWWALTSDFRELLAKNSLTDDDRESMNSILAYINNLYTVYTNLFIYDSEGEVIAVSNPGEKALIGSRLQSTWVNDALQIRNSQHYCVSKFELTSLYSDRHTYIYNTAITSLTNSNHVLGGIGIVFDSEVEFSEMLRDTLPCNVQGEPFPGSLGLFTDRNGMIISMAQPVFELNVGGQLSLPEKFFSLPAGQGLCEIVVYQKQYYAVGACASSGYREYKSQDDCYENDVISFIMVPLGEDNHDSQDQLSFSTSDHQRVGYNGSNRDSVVEVATFYVGRQWFGVNASSVREASAMDGVCKLIGSGSNLLGTKIYDEHALPIYNLHRLTNQLYIENLNHQIVVFKTEQGDFGCCVDHLGVITEFEEQSLDGTADSIPNKVEYITGVVSTKTEGDESDQDDKKMLLIIDPDKLYSYLKDNNES